MDAKTTTSTPVATQPANQPGTASTPAPPPAPVKKPAHLAWADMVDDMDTMPLQRAKSLTPSEIGAMFGPVMDERQFQQYRQARAKQGREVRILK
jgi:hypothetical protein